MDFSIGKTKFRLQALSYTPLLRSFYFLVTYTFPLYTYYLSSFDSLDTYDVTTCVIRCTTKRGYISFNIYFERDLSGIGSFYLML